MARTSWYSGPGFVIRNSVRHTAETTVDVVTTLLDEPIMVPYLGGKQGGFLVNRTAVVTLQPKTIWTSAAFAEYFPWSAVEIGGELYPGTDVPLYVYGKDGTKMSFAASCLEDYPELDLSFKAQNVVGPLKYLCFQSADTDFTTANSFMQLQTSQSVPTTDAFSAGNLVKVHFTGNLGSGPSAPWLNFTTVNGFKIKPSIKSTVKSCDRWGDNQRVVDSVEAVAEFTLMPEASAAIATKAAWAGATARGALLSPLGDLVITGGTTPKLLTVTLHNMQLDEFETEYAVNQPRNKRLKMTAQGNGTNSIVGDWFETHIS